MLHKAHATNRLSTTIESEAIRGPYFQRLQAGSKYMDLVSENIDNLREVTSEDLAAINDSLDRLSTGYETLEIRFKKLSRQMEDTKHRLQSSKALLYDNIHKTSNAIQHLNAKQQSNPFMKALLAVLGWVILIVGTLIWLFAATFRAAMRTVRYIQNIFTGKKQQPSHTSSSTPKRPDMARLPITKMPSNPAKSEMTSSSIKNSGDSYPDSIPPRSGSKPSSLHNSSHDISRSTGGSSTASIGSSRGDEDDSSFASDEDDSRWTPSKLASPPVQLETHQLQTLEDMSKSIKALRNQELAAKRRLAAAAEKSKQVSARNPTSTPNAPQQ
jgi:septal ring factor EnvC (AmiA/AmiB activator)